MDFMDDEQEIAENISYSFEEQSQLQIHRLKQEIIKNETDPCETKRLQRHRLYRQNIFEDLDPKHKSYQDCLLRMSLTSLGGHIYQNLMNSATSQPTFAVDLRELGNFMYDKDGVIHLKPKKYIKLSSISLTRQALILHIITKVLRLIDKNTYISKRELYYVSLRFCQIKRHARSPTLGSRPHTRFDPKKIERALDDICCLMGCSKVNLHILSQPRGIIYGSLQITLKSGETFDCLAKSDGTALPSSHIPIVKVESDANFLIVVEKDSVFQRMLHQESIFSFVKTYKVLIFTAKGYPDVNSRAFLNFLWTKLQIPMLLLTDADPHGLEIACCYKFGCYATAYESTRTTVPIMKWLGLLPSDVARLSIPREKTLPLSHNDLKKLESLSSRPYLTERPSWMRQIGLLRESGRKAELESLDTDGEYLVRTYLPNKLRYASWL